MVPVDLICDLRDPGTRPEMIGAKAANLAAAARIGLPTLPGLVLTTAAVARGLADPEVRAAVEEIFRRLGGGSGRPLVVRSSSTIEDAGSSSMAGRFTSILGVLDRDDFLRAVEAVVASADRVRDEAGCARPLAVLVQPQADAAFGGVMFGVDPVSGDRSRIIVAVVAGSPDGLVSGRLVADQYVLTRHGRLVVGPTVSASPQLDRGLRRRLADVARRSEHAFGGPQDIEWLVEPGGALVVLQTRPVTAIAAPVTRSDARGAARSVLLGPGPVAETFPDPLTRLEADLWIAPLAEGIRAAVRATRAVSPRELERSPVVTTVDGWAVADLELLGVARGQRSFRRRVSPTAIGRRLAAAWSVGRVRAQFPEVAATVVATVDRHLAELGSFDSRSLPELGEMLLAARRELGTVHTHEVLAGMLLSRVSSADAGVLSAAGVALSAVEAGRARGWSDRQIIARTPEVLMLVPPRVGGVDELAPSTVRGVGGNRALDRTTCTGMLPASAPIDMLGPREALRLRARWLQELLGRLVGEIGARLEAEGRLIDRRALGQLDVSELLSIARGASVPEWLTTPASLVEQPPGQPLPSSFRWSPTEAVHREPVSSGNRRERSGARLTGTAAGGGLAVGAVVHDPVAVGETRRPVLVVRHLDPRLAPVLASLSALVAETGSPLSHLAILAREAGVPTVVALADAQRRLPVGVAVEVDGRRGDVHLLSAADEWR